MIIKEALWTDSPSSFPPRPTVSISPAYDTTQSKNFRRYAWAELERAFVTHLHQLILFISCSDSPVKPISGFGLTLTHCGCQEPEARPGIHDPLLVSGATPWLFTSERLQGRVRETSVSYSSGVWTRRSLAQSTCKARGSIECGGRIASTGVCVQYGVIPSRRPDSYLRLGAFEFFLTLELAAVDWRLLMFLTSSLKSLGLLLLQLTV